MRYLCLAYGDRTRMEALSPSELEALMSECRRHDEELRQSGHLVRVESLGWGATTLRPGHGKVLVTDGPFVETKEQVGGLFVIEARDLNEAIRIASLHPAAHLGHQLGWGIEVRPIAEGCHR